MKGPCSAAQAEFCHNESCSIFCPGKMHNDKNSEQKKKITNFQEKTLYIYIFWHYSHTSASCDFNWSNHSHRLMFLSLPLRFVLPLNPDLSSCLKGSEFYESILRLPFTNSHENTEICMADRQFSLIYSPFEVYYTVWFPWWANPLPTGELSCWMSPVSSIRNHQHPGP